MKQPNQKCKFDAFLRFEAGFLMTHQNPLFDALLRGKAGFLMKRQKGANLLNCYRLKQVFP